MYFLSCILFSTCIGLIVYLFYKNKNAHSFWARRGIKGPKPWPLVGNWIQLVTSDRMKQSKEWPRLYGNVFGFYWGLKPYLFVADAEVLQQICIKDFDVFTNHDSPEFLNKYNRGSIFFQQDKLWKRLRALQSTTFTSSKIKRMFKLLDTCADDLIECFDEQLLGADKRATVNVKDTYNLFTMDAIATCCYGLKLERVSGSTDLKSAASRNDFVPLAMAFLTETPWRMLAAIVVPGFVLRWFGFSMYDIGGYELFAKTIKQLLDKRRKSQKKFGDYMQLLIDANIDDDDHSLEQDEMDLAENHHVGVTPESLQADRTQLMSDLKTVELTKRTLTEFEIVTSCMFLLAVGLETTATMLTHCSYLLAFHPEVQEKLYEEVKKIAEYKDETKTHFTYEALTSCQYLDAVISETLRYLSPVFNLDRVASRDYKLEKYNLDIPKGCVVATAYYAIMNNPEYWPEPGKFDPERFMPGNKEKIVPGSYCPFGIGPRHCLGMRFSLTEGKLALAKTIMKYRFEPAAGSKFPPVLKGRFDMASLSEPLVTIVARY